MIYSKVHSQKILDRKVKSRSLAVGSTSSPQSCPRKTTPVAQCLGGAPCYLLPSTSAHMTPLWPLWLSHFCIPPPQHLSLSPPPAPGIPSLALLAPLLHLILSLHTPSCEISAPCPCLLWPWCCHGSPSLSPTLLPVTEVPSPGTGLLTCLFLHQLSPHPVLLTLELAVFPLLLEFFLPL